MITDLKVGPAHYSKAGFIDIGFYSGGAVALTIVNDCGEVQARATVNMPEIALPDDHIILKNWSENMGIPEALEKAGLVEITENGVSNGFVTAPIAKMTPALIEQVQKARGEA